MNAPSLNGINYAWTNITFVLFQHAQKKYNMVKRLKKLRKQ